MKEHSRMPKYLDRREHIDKSHEFSFLKKRIVFVVCVYACLQTHSLVCVCVHVKANTECLPQSPSTFVSETGSQQT